MTRKNFSRLGKVTGAPGGPGAPCANDRRMGFTMAEMVVVLLIMAIMGAVAAPQWNDSLERLRVSNAANRIAVDLARAQSAAYTASTSTSVTFSVSSNKYVMSGVASPDRSSAPYVVLLKDEPCRSTLVSVWGRTDTQSITFNGYGQPNQGGEIVVAAGRFRKSVLVDAVSGNVVIP